MHGVKNVTCLSRLSGFSQRTRYSVCAMSDVAVPQQTVTDLSSLDEPVRIDVFLEGYK